MISRLEATDGVSDEEAASLAMGLLFAGQETIVAAIGLGALLLLTHPDQRQALLDEPSLILRTVEETLRAPGRGGGGIPRYARTDVAIGGVTIQGGQLVLLEIMAANHDENIFPEADTFDINRQAAMNMAFGHRPRYCIGVPLARVELQVVFAQLITRFRDMRLAVPLTEVTLDRNVPGGGLARLPVTW